MVRPILIHLGLFLMPLIVYATYLWVIRADPRKFENWKGKPIITLTFIGFVLMAASLVVLSNFSGAEPGSEYVPAQVKDGVLVPGYFK